MAPKNQQHWQQVKETFHEALRLDAGARGPFLDRVCDGDAEFRIEVESLLISLAEAKNFLEPPVIGTTPKPDSSWRLNAGEIISHYRIVSHIASGGMGEVYLAEDQKLYRQVALKVLPEHLNADRDRLRRFQREAQAVSTLNHPNILTIFEFDEQDSMHIFASEFVRGETLRERIKRGNLPVSECLDIGIQIASALQAAHSAGVIHRDIKPENIMIRDDGLVKVLDFGLAKLTERVSNSDADTQMHFLSHPGLIMGTAAYMSPEQARAVSIDARTDIFSLGVVQYEMLAGKPPFSGDTTADIIAAMIQSDPLRISSIVPSVPDDLDAIIAKAMKKDRNDRYASAAEMLVAMKLLRRQIETESETKETLSLDERSNADTKILEAKIYSEDFQRSSNDPISIAILPFRNLTRNTTVNFYSFSLADAVITELLRIRSLRVSPSSVIAKYEDYKDDPVTIAKELRVETVLSASYLVSDNRIRVTSQLIDVSNGQVLWGERIEATANDVITIQDTIAQHIIEGLQLNIGAQEARALIAMRSINPNAYEEYLRGRDCFLRYVYRTVDEKDISQAIGHFENAVELDPNFSLGFTALGTCYLNRIHKSFGTMQDITLARDALDKGILMDPGDFDARAGRAYVHLIQGEKREAHKQLAELRKIVPHNATVHFYSMVLYRLSGDYENGLRSVNEVLRLNPAGQVVAGYNRSRFFMYQQRYNEAMAELTKAAKIEPNHPFVKFYTAIALFRTGDASSAKKILEELVIASPREAFRPHLAICLSSLGEHESAREQITEDLKRVAKTDPDLSYWLASAYLMEDEFDHAFRWLEYSIKIGNENLPWLESNPIWSPVSNDPRFRAIIQQLRDELYEVHSNIRRPNQLLAGTRAADRPLNFWTTTTENLSGQRSAPGTAAIELLSNPQTSESKTRWSFRSAALPAVAIVLMIGLAVGLFWQFNKNTDSGSFDALRPVRLVSWKSGLGSFYTDYRASHDGKMIAYSTTQNGENEEIYVKQIAGGDEIRVTKDEWHNYSPIWSPDDQSIAFISRREGQTGIYVSPAFGGAVVPIKMFGEGYLSLRHWSRDGTAIYYDLKGNLFRLDLATKEAAQMTDLPDSPDGQRYFSFSPDEERIAYCNNRGGEGDVWMMPRTGGEPIRLTNDIDKKLRPRWHPDGKRILYNVIRDGRSQINLIHTDGRPPVQVTRGDAEYELIDVSADGTKIFFTTWEKRSDIGRVNIESGEEFEVEAGIESEFWADISPDGKSILFQTNAAPHLTLFLSQSSIVVKSLTGQSPPVSIKGYNPRWLHDGRGIVFLRKAEEIFNLWRLNISSGEQTQITTEGVSPPVYGVMPLNRAEFGYYLSPDGKRVAYLDPKKQNIWAGSLEPPETRSQLNIDSPNTSYRSPIWSPESERIAYVSRETLSDKTQKPLWGLWVVEQGKAKQIFSTDESVRLLGWSMSGDELILEMTEGEIKASPSDIKLARVSMTGVNRQVGTFRNIYATSMILSTDGKTVAYTARRNDKDDIWTAATNGGAETKLTANRNLRIFYASLVWSPEGKTIFFDRQEQNHAISMFEDFQ